MKSILSFVLFLCALGLDAQDVIYKKDKTKIDAKVLEVGATDIKYKPSSNPEGPVYILPKADVSTIVFQNGTFEIFSDDARSSRRKKFDSLSVNFCRNYIGIDIGEFTNTAVGMTYEHTFGKKGTFAIRIPFSIGAASYNYQYYSSSNKIFSLGLDLLFFPTGQGKLKYYTAPYFEWGMHSYMNYIMSNNGSYYDFAPSYSYIGQRFAGGVKNGILFQPTKHFAISADFGFGIQRDEVSYPYPSISPQARANLIIGYRF